MSDEQPSAATVQEPPAQETPPPISAAQLVRAAREVFDAARLEGPVIAVKNFINGGETVLGFMEKVLANGRETKDPPQDPGLPGPEQQPGPNRP